MGFAGKKIVRIRMQHVGSYRQQRVAVMRVAGGVIHIKRPVRDGGANEDMLFNATTGKQVTDSEFVWYIPAGDLRDIQSHPDFEKLGVVA
jgi:hypothetical protein